jgi:hypothetical protein
MSISTQLYALLSAGATDAGTRIYPLTAGPSPVATPYITFQTVAGVPDAVMSGSSGLIKTRMQLDLYATTHALAETLKAQVEALLAGWSLQNTELSAQDFYEADVKLFRVLLDYSIWHT